MPIPLVDLQAQYQTIKHLVDQAMSRVVRDSQFILGEEVRLFEDDFAEFCGASYCVGLSSGTAALALALRALGIGPQDEVITTPLTFTATAEAICHVGAVPVFADVDPHTLCLASDQVERVITPRTKVIMPVHLYGNPCDMASLMSLAREYGLTVLEDAAQAHGAMYRQRPVGTFGAAGCFSFYPGKNLGAYGDAGAVVTNDPEVARKVALLRDHGRVAKYEHLEIGYGERIDALQAAILRVKLGFLADWTRARREWARLYTEGLRGLPVTVVSTTPESYEVYHIFAILTDRREALITHLRRLGVHTGIHYPIPLHLQPCYGYLGYAKGAMPISEKAADMVLSLPMYPELGEARVKMVLEAIRSFDQW